MNITFTWLSCLYNRFKPLIYKSIKHVQRTEILLMVNEVYLIVKHTNCFTGYSSGCPSQLIQMTLCKHFNISIPNPAFCKVLLTIYNFLIFASLFSYDQIFILYIYIYIYIYLIQLTRKKTIKAKQQLLFILKLAIPKRGFSIQHPLSFHSNHFLS